MQAKPIVTCHGNMVLFSKVHPKLAQDLPKEAAEWRRSYGRPPRNVQIEASFVPYDDDILPEETVKTLISRPYFHIYWTNCDLDIYKQDIKEEITNWHQALKARNISDWLIVVNEENKVKTKLLPRSSVYDKVKSEFCSKQPERCIVLSESDQKSATPDTKPSESWTIFIARMRQLLLQAFTRHLSKYEDNMRALREKRNEAGWNFQQYFLVQEELGFMFEMLGLFDDAMIQYDELDALFTQFVLNHASGVPVGWLQTLTRPCTSWAGMSLHKPIDWLKRDLIRDNEASFLEFRNYLFSRQCALLFLLKRPWEIVRRTIDFLHNTVQEVKSLEKHLQMPQGSLDCWVYLSGLEVLQHCEHYSTTNVKDHALHTANLWDYVCRKLRALGEICGLMPDADNQPSSEQLLLVVDLTSGMGLEKHEDDDEDVMRPVPSDKLREAMSSKESFQKIYLEQSELAMGTFKHIGRFRSARMIGKNLADFYMKLNEPQKAENFLLDAMKSYHQEGWKLLTDRSRLELAQCQYRVGDDLKFVKTACQVAGSSVLDDSDRHFYMLQVLRIAEVHTGSPILLKASSLFQVDVTDIQDRKITQDQSYTIDIIVVNNAPVDVHCDKLWLTLVDFIPDAVIENQRTAQLKEPVCRQGSDASLENRLVMNLQPIKKQLPNIINLRAHFEGMQTSPVSSGIACVNTHELLKRADSSSVKGKDQELNKDTVSQTVAVENILLKQGINSIKLSPQASSSGFFRPGQVGIKLKAVEFLKDLETDLYCTVVSNDTYCEIQPDLILAGVTQKVKVTMHTGSHHVSADSKVEVRSSRGLTVDTRSAEGSIHDNMIQIGEISRGSRVDWEMEVFQETRADVPVKMENKLAFDCSWLPRPLLATVSFLHPLSVTHKLHTAKEKKYVQILIHGNSETEFLIPDWNLFSTNTNDVELVRLNKPGQTLIDWRKQIPFCFNCNHMSEDFQKISKDQSGSCMWLVKSNVADFPPLDLKFTLEYRSLEALAETVKQIPYTFKLESFQTQLTVDCDIVNKGEQENCKAGSLASLKVQVIPMSRHKLPEDQELLYDIDREQSNWAIYGKSTGNFNLLEGGYNVNVDVMPLVSGFIPVPRVKVFKYRSSSSEKDIWSEKADLELEAIETLDTSDEEEDTDSAGPVSFATLGRTEFQVGQVYYSSLGKQVRVYPESATGDIEVTVL